MSPTSPSTPLNTLMTGIKMGECPRWHADRLWFADWGAQELIALELQGHHEVIARVPSFPFSFDWLPDGRLLIVSASEKRLFHLNSDGTFVPYADLSILSNKPWNELVIDSRGNAYVNNIGFDFGTGDFAPGIVALVTPDGTVRQVADGIAFPNGMVVSPDNSTLIVAGSYSHNLTAFDIAPDGTLSNQRVWADLGDAAPDGICLDAEGAVWYADVPHKQCVRVSEGGEVLQTVTVDRGCFACMLGGTTEPTLFIVAAEWNGPEKMFSGPPAGQILTTLAPAPRAGFP